MNASQATIQIKNLRLSTFIGFNSGERSKKQGVVIDSSIRHQPDASVFQDEVEGALDYKALTKAIIKHVREGRFLLLEKLVNDLVLICSERPSVLQAIVTVEKPHALRFADSVSLTLEYDRNQNQ